MNYEAKINLLSLRGAAVCNLTWKNKTTKKCVVLPIEDCVLYDGAKGVYLDLSINERREVSQYGGWTHSIRHKISGEAYKAMTEEERKTIPFLGDMKPNEFKPATTPVSEEIVMPSNDDDLIF